MTEKPTPGIIALHKKDNVATTIADLKANQEIHLESGLSLILPEPIPAGHKLALREIPEKMEVIKYGEVIGITTRSIPAGRHVHIHNVQSLRGRGDLKVKNELKEQKS